MRLKSVKTENWANGRQKPTSPSAALPNGHFPLILVEESLGTGSASYLASRYSSHYEAVILLAPLTSIAAMADFYLTKPWASQSISGNHFDNLRYLQKYSGHVLLMHVQENNIIPAEHSVQLYNTLMRRNGHGIVEAIYHPSSEHLLNLNEICGSRNPREHRRVNGFLDMGWSKTRVAEEPPGPPYLAGGEILVCHGATPPRAFPSPTINLLSHPRKIAFLYRVCSTDPSMLARRARYKRHKQAGTLLT